MQLGCGIIIILHCHRHMLTMILATLLMGTDSYVAGILPYKCMLSDLGICNIYGI